MDRRTALKKLAAGGALTTGAVVVRSSPAFAMVGSDVCDTGPPALRPILPPSFVVSLVSPYADSFQSQWQEIQIGVPQCAPPPPDTAVGPPWSERRWSMLQQPPLNPASINPSGGVAGIFIKNNGAFATMLPLSGTLLGTYVFRLEVRLVCSYNDVNSNNIPGDQTEIAWQCQQIDTTFTINPSAPWQTINSQVTTNCPAGCNSPPPTPGFFSGG